MSGLGIGFNANVGMQSDFWQFLTRCLPSYSTGVFTKPPFAQKLPRGFGQLATGHYGVWEYILQRLYKGTFQYSLLRTLNPIL